MPNAILKRFTVTGRGGFPFDLLRIDQCWPATPADASFIDVAAEDPNGARSVVLETAVKYAPDRRRWALAGWRVAD